MNPFTAAQTSRPLAINSVSVLVTGIVALLLLSASSGVAQQQPELNAEQIAREGRASTVTIFALGARGDTIGIGSGVSIRAGGVILTNWHVLQGASAAIVRIADGRSYRRVSFLDGDSTVDVALIQVDGADLRPARVTPDIPSVGSRVLVIGAPEGLTFTVSDGLVSAIRMYESNSLIQISAAISPGSSGGPVFDKYGRVFAIASLTLNKGQLLNFARPVRYAMALLPFATKPRAIASVFAPRQRSMPSRGLQRDDGGSARLVFPSASGLTVRLAGVYRVRHQLASDVRLSRGVRTGSAVLDGVGGGVVVLGNTSGFPIVRMRGSPTGDVNFELNGESGFGYHSKNGFAGIVPLLNDTLFLIASRLTSRSDGFSGLYAVSGQSTTLLGEGRESEHTATLFGYGSLVASRDSAFLLISLREPNGLVSNGFARAALSTQGVFRGIDQRGNTIVGRVGRETLSIDWMLATGRRAILEGKVAGR